MTTGPKSRAPLGMKTTNAKTTKYLTPALNLLDKDLSNQNQKSTTIRKLKPKTPHAENTELAVLGDKDELDEREIEYMPPPTKGNNLNLDRRNCPNSSQISQIFQMIAKT